VYTVYAPKGKLGIVLENPDREGPIVYIIKEMSPLLNKLAVGDRLIAVDEVVVRDMSPTKISKLISKRSANPMRKLTLVKSPPATEQETSVEDGRQSDERGAEEEKEEDVEAVTPVSQSAVCVDQSFESSEDSRKKEAVEVSA